MKILNKDDGSKGMFYIEKDGKHTAIMTYVWAGKNIIIDHTEIDRIHSGKGIGRQLLEKAVNFAREKNIKIMPLCPFAKSVFDKDKDLHDVLL